ncbi:MAG TPA: ribosome maturation factor RimP [Limnochorda sp.]
MGSEGRGDAPQRGASRAHIANLVRPLAEAAASEHGVELVDVELVREHGQRILRVTIDKPTGDRPGGGITLDDCERVSQSLSERLDALGDDDPVPGPYALEVSSPGIERPLLKDVDFVRFAGYDVQVRCYAPVEGRKVWQGRLLGLQDGAVALEVPGRADPVLIPRGQVARARLAPAWPEL